MQRATIILAVFATGTLAVPTPQTYENKCAQLCLTRDETKFNYEPGKTYVYDFASDIETTLSGATDDASRLHVTATAEITANSGCDFTLQLLDVTLSGSEPKNSNIRDPVQRMESFKRELERRPLSFSWQDGRIDHLCATEDEPVWVLNIKRGLLSTLVNTMDSLQSGKDTSDETDVSGTCSTSYEVESEGNLVVVKKTKDLLTCRGRGHLISSIHTTPYKSHSNIQSLPLLKSDLQCEQRVSSGRLHTVACVETQQFRPFSQQQHGALTTTTVRLTERETRSYPSRSHDSDAATVTHHLAFDHTDPELKHTNHLDVAVQLLDELKAKTSEDVRPDVPHLFTRFIGVLRHFDHATLTTLLDRVTDASSRRYVVDALPLAGSAASMAVMRDLIQRREVTDAESDRWMTALAFVHEPTVEMVESVSLLLEGENVRKQTLLGVSSLVHHYCEWNQLCLEDTAVRTAVQALEGRLGSSCTARSPEHLQDILATLKAIGNIGRAVNGLEHLHRCYQNGNPMEVRLAAIKALHRMPCTSDSEHPLLNIFANRGEDSEVRIAAYLTIMECPNRNLVDKIQEILFKEAVNEVSTFVWTHLSNMQETSDPNKSYLKSLLYSVDLSEKFNSDKKKMSRYFEKTLFYDSMNVGATVEGNVIFSPDSYMPRSGALDLTVDLFGESINLLEIGGRVEGLNDIVDGLFGSSGVYPQQSLNQLLRTVRGNLVGSETPSASTYMKIFGNELRFNKFESLHELISAFGARNPLEFLQRLAKDMDWTENYQFLDTSYKVPTIAGMPLTLKAVGTAAISIKTGGSFDVQSWSKVNIDGFLKPSAAVEIKAEMGVDAHVARTGLMMNTNLHTATVFDGRALVDGGKVVSVKINMPKDKIEILDVTTRFHMLQKNKVQQMEMLAGNRFEYKGCSDKYTSALLGVNFCGDVSYSQMTENTPNCLFTGPITARFTVEKTDTIQAFTFDYHHSNDDEVRKSNLVIDTPGSSIDRRLTADYSINFNSKTAQAGFHSPIKSAGVSGTLDLEGVSKRAEFRIEVDNEEFFGISSSLTTDDTPITVRYAPSLVISGRNGEIVNVQGDFIANKNKFKYNADLEISKIFDKPIKFKGWLTEEDGTYDMYTSLNSPLLDTSTTGTFRCADNNLLVQSNTEYRLMGGQSHTVQLSAKLGTEKHETTTTYKAFVDTKFSALPFLDNEMTVEYRCSPGGGQLTALVKRDEREWLLTSTLRTKPVIEASLGFQANHLDIDYKLGGKVDLSKSGTVTVSGEAQLNSARFVRAEISGTVKAGPKAYHYGIDGQLALPASQYQLQLGVRREGHTGHAKFIAAVERGGVRKELSAVLLLELEGADSRAELTLRVPGWVRVSATLHTTVQPGRYLLDIGLQLGSTEYRGRAEYSATERNHHQLLLLLRRPTATHSAQLDATLEPHLITGRADLRPFSGRRILTTLTVHPADETKTLDMEVFWNKDVDDTQKVTISGTFSWDTASAQLNYPGRDIRLVATRRENGMVVDIQYAPEKTIHAEGEFALNFDSHSNGEFTAELTVTTPVRNWERLQMAVRYHGDRNTFSVSTTAAKNVKQFHFSVDTQNTDGLKFDSKFDLDLPFNSLKKIKAGFGFDFGRDHLDASVLAFWETYKPNEISLTLNCNHNLRHDQIINTELVVKTPFHGFEQSSAKLKFELDPTKLETALGFTLNQKEIFHVELNGYHPEISTVKANFDFACVHCPSISASLDLHGDESDRSSSIEVRWRDQELSFKTHAMQRSPTQRSLMMTLVIPYPRRVYEVKHNFEMRASSATESTEITFNGRKITFDMSSEWSAEIHNDRLKYLTINGNGRLTTPFEGYESFEVKNVATVDMRGESILYDMSMELFKGDKKIDIVDNLRFTSLWNWQYSREMTSNTELFSHFTVFTELDATSGKSFKISANANWDGEIAELTYSHQLSKKDVTNKLDVYATAKWFTGGLRSLKTDLSYSEAEVTPSIAITYAPGKTITLFGTIQLLGVTSESQLTLETPFTETMVLKVDHRTRVSEKQVGAEFMYGSKTYSVQVRTGYVEGHVDIRTPHLGFTALSAQYQNQGDTVELRLRRENRQIKAVLANTNTDEALGRTVTVMTPYRGFERMVVSFNKPWFGNTFTAAYNRGRHTSISLTGSYELASSEPKISIEADTNLPGFSNVKLDLSLDKNEKTAKAELDKEGEKMELSVSADFAWEASNIDIEFKNDMLGGPKKVKVGAKFDLTSPMKIVDFKIEKDNEEYHLGGVAKLPGESASVSVSLEAGKYKTMKLLAEYDVTFSPLGMAKIELLNDNEVFSAVLSSSFEPREGEVELEIKTPINSFRHLVVGAKYEDPVRSGGYKQPVSAKLIAQFNSVHKEISSSFTFDDERFQLVINTPFHNLETLEAEGGYTENIEKIWHLTLSRNEEAVGIVLKGQCDFSHSETSLEITTPLVSAKKLGIVVRYDFRGDEKTFSVDLMRNERHLKMDMSGLMGWSAGHARVDIDTPYSGWDEVQYAFIYNFNQPEKRFELVYSKNGQKTVLASKGGYKDNSAYLDVVTPFEGYENMGASARYVNTRGKREAEYDAHVNDHRHRVYLLYEREGLDNARLRIETPIPEMSLIEITGRSEHTADGRVIYIDTNRDGKRNSAELRITRSDEVIGIDAYVKTYFEGLENVKLSGSVQYAGRRKSINLSSEGVGQPIRINADLVARRRRGNGSLKAALPFPGLEDVDIEFSYKVGKSSSFELTSTRNGVTRKFSGSFEYSDSSFSLDISTPYEGFENVHAEGSRSVDGSGKVTASLNLRRNNRAISVAYNYLFSKASGEGSIDVTTPYSGFRKMEMSVNYNIQSNSRQMSLYAKRGRRVWDIKTTRKWTDGTDEASLTLTSPLEQLQSLTITRSYDIRDLSAMSYSGQYNRNGRKLEITATGSIKERGKEAAFNVIIDTPLEVGRLSADIQYNFSSQESKTVSANLSAGRRYAKLDATLARTYGTINLVTTNQKLPKLDIDYTAEFADSDRLKALNANLVLADGRKLSVVYNAENKLNEGEGNVKVTSTTYGVRELQWSYTNPGDDLTADISYDSPNLKLEWSISVQGKMFVRRKIIIKSDVQSEVYTSSRQAVIRYNLKNKVFLNADITSNGDKYLLNVDISKNAGSRIVSITYDGKLVKDWSLDGKWTIPTSIEGNKDFEITIKHEGKTVTLNGNVDMGAEGKTGSAKIHLQTPHEAVADLNIEGNWNFVLPNRILKIDYSRNGRNFLIDFTGSRYPGKGEYVLRVSMPPLPTQTGKYFSEIEYKVKYDVTDGVYVKYGLTKPLVDTTELDLKMTETMRKGKLVIHQEDENDLFSWLDHRHLEINTKRTERPQGPKVEITFQSTIPGLEKVELDVDVTRSSGKRTVTVDYKRGDRVAHLTGEVQVNEGSGSFSVSARTPIEGFENVQLNGNYEVDHGKKYSFSVDYSRGQKHVHLSASTELDITRRGDEFDSGSVSGNIKLDSLITMPVQLNVDFEGTLKTRPRRSGSGKVTGTFNGKTMTLTYKVDREQSGLRTAHLELTTPFKQPFRKIVYHSEVSLPNNKASISVAYGRRRITLDVSWFPGEANVYGAEVRFTSPFPPVSSLELDVKFTANRDHSLDVLVHYRRVGKMVHVTGKLRPFIADLDFETPTYGNFNVKAGVIVDPSEKKYSLQALYTHQSGMSAGGEITVKALAMNDMQFTVDIHTPVESWERLNLDVAYSNTDQSNLVRVAFQSPLTKRLEVSVELTNRGNQQKTDFKAGITTNYLGNAFTFRTNIFRDSSGMKYELEVESPFHILPSFRLTGRR